MVYQCQKTQAVNLRQERLGHSPALGQGSMMLGMRLYFISTNKQIIMRKVVGHAKSFTVYHSRNVVNLSSIRPSIKYTKKLRLSLYYIYYIPAILLTLSSNCRVKYNHLYSSILTINFNIIFGGWALH